MIVFNDRVLPASNHKLRQLQGDIARKKPTFGLREQIINQVADRQVYLKAMKLGTDNRMTDVTIYDLTDVMRRRTIYADSGKLAFAPNGKDLVLTLYKGTTIEVPRAEPGRLQRASFDQNFVRVEGVANQLELTRSDSYKSDREMTICELQNDVARYEAEFTKARKDLRDALLRGDERGAHRGAGQAAGDLVDHDVQRHAGFHRPRDRLTRHWAARTATSPCAQRQRRQRCRRCCGRTSTPRRSPAQDTTPKPPARPGDCRSGGLHAPSGG